MQQRGKKYLRVILLKHVVQAGKLLADRCIQQGDSYICTVRA